MALIGTIRKNSWLLVVLIAVGMGGFILQSIVSGGNQYSAADANTVGKINGVKIDNREFQEAEGVLYGNSSTSNMYANKASLWNYFKNKAIAESIGEDVGLGVSNEELIDMEFGQNLSPIITSRFKNKQTGVVDKNQLTQIKQSIDEGTLNPEYKRFWAVQEKEIITDRLRTKMSNIVSKALYTPSWYAEDITKLNDSKANFKYVKIPFDKIADDQVEVSDAAITSYINDHKAVYTNKEEKRALKYVVIDVKPTEKDVANLKKDATVLANNFKKSENDSLFTISRDGVFPIVYYKYDELPEALKKDSVRWNKGDVIGPYRDKDIFSVAKIVDKKIVPDSAKARHILLSVQPGDAEGYAKAKATIDSLKTLLVEGKASFDSLAIKFSQDPGSAAKGGDLGTFAQGRMVPEFNNACFHGNKGNYYVVTTRFGVHLIDVQNQIFNTKEQKYRVAYINTNIIPSEDTQDSLLTVASDVITESQTPEDFEVNVKKLNFDIKKSMPLTANDYTFMELGQGQTSREIIRWAFEPVTEHGDIAPQVFIYSNKALYYNEKYILAYLSDIYPEGLRSVDQVRNDVETLVKNKLKADKIIASITAKDLSAISSQFDTKVEEANDVVFNAKFVNNLGNEPKVINLAFNGEAGQTLGPVVGNSGVFYITPTSMIKPTAETNLISAKKKISDEARANVGFKLFDAFSNSVEVKDNRKKFF